MSDSLSDADEVRARLRARIAAIESGDGAGGPAGDAEKERGRGHAAREERRPSHREDAPDAGGLQESRAAKASEAGEASEVERAFRKIERLACRREQASEALRRRLVREGFEEEAVEEALGHAMRCGLVDDGRYAEVLVRSRLAQGRGRRGIAAELAGLGIDAEAVAPLSDGFEGDEGEVERALDLLDRKPPRSKNRREAAYRRLVQKGFAADAAVTAARLWCEANPD